MPGRTRLIESGFVELERVGARRMSGLGKSLVRKGAANAPVRRGYRSYDESLGPLGGTLRGSISYAVAVDGRIVDGPTDGNGAGTPGWIGEELEGRRDTVELVVFTNTGETVNPLSGDAHDYGLWVHEGTSRMPGRPFLLEALQETDLSNMGGGGLGEGGE
jgi:hypothetical protein